MEQLNYSFFLLLLGDRLLKTDGQGSVHTLAGEAGCSRAVGGRADSCMVASRHPGNCLSMGSVWGALVLLWCLQLGAHSGTCACTWNPARPHRLGHGHQTCAEVQSHRHHFLKSHLFFISLMLSLPCCFVTAFQNWCYCSLFCTH